MGNYICKLNDGVRRSHVRYSNRYGIPLASDLYTAKDMGKDQKYPAIVVGAPYGGVKEQGPCVYANELARRGFVVLTFDPCYMDESGGEPRHVSSPDLFSENISAGEQAESRFFTDMAFEKAAEPKQMLVVADCNHVDLYDDTSKIPFNDIEKFLRDSLR